MRTINRLAASTCAAALLAGASMSALAWAALPGVDFEWYANVGKYAAPADAFPEARAGYIWAPGHWESHATAGQTWVAGRWIRDDFEEQKIAYGVARPTVAAKQ